MFTVFFIQTLADGSTVRSNATYETLLEAKARFYLELAQVGTESGPKEVKAIIFNDELVTCAFETLSK